MVSHVYSRDLPDVANLHPSLLQGVIADVPSSCGGPTSQSSSSKTDQNELKTNGKRAEADLPDQDYVTFPDETCPAVTNPSNTKARKMVCPDGLFVYDLCCSGPTEETGDLFPNILNCRFSTSKTFRIAQVS